MSARKDTSRMSSVIIRFLEVNHLQDGHVVFLETNNWASKDVLVRGGRAVFENESVNQVVYLKKRLFSSRYKARRLQVRLYEKATSALTKSRIIGSTKFDLVEHVDAQGQKVERNMVKQRKVRSRGDTALTTMVHPVLIASIDSQQPASGLAQQPALQTKPLAPLQEVQMQPSLGPSQVGLIPTYELRLAPVGGEKVFLDVSRMSTVPQQPLGVAI